MHPAVSVIVNVYNGEADVIDALTSIRDQTFTDFEVVVWDDGSTDRTAELVRAFVCTDPRFRLCLAGENQGLLVGRERAIRETAAPWIAICDADDVWLPTKLERQMDQICAHEERSEDPPLVVVGTSGHHVNAEGRIRGLFDTGLHTREEYNRFRQQGRAFYILNSSAVFRRDVFEAVGGFRADYFPGEDVDLWTRMAERGLILNLDENLVHYRIQGGSISDEHLIRQMFNTLRVKANVDRRFRGMEEISHEAFMAQLRANPSCYRRTLRSFTAQSLYRHAGTALANSRYRTGIALMLRSLVLDPWVPISRVRRQLLRRGALRRLFQ